MAPKKNLETSYSRDASFSQDGLSNFKSVFNGNMKKINDVESQLGTKRVKIVGLANAFMI